MNDQTQELINGLLQRAISGVDAAVAFGQEQIPQVILELLWWHGVRSVLAFAILLALFGGALAVMRRAFAAKKAGPISIDNDGRRPYVSNMAYDRDGDLFPFFMIMFGCTTTAFLLSIALLNSLDWLQILIAPRLYLIEYAAELAK